MRAYHNAIKLLEMGIRTPLPIGAIDSYNNGLLKSSFFVSEYSDYTPMTVIHSPLWEKDIELLKAVAQFFAQIHQLGIQHNDLNAANVRYRIGEEGYEFELIDNNRIRFKNRPLTERERLTDLRHFACGTVQYVFMLEQYALLTGIDKEAFATKGVVSKFGYDLRVGFRRMLKSKFR